MSKNKNPKKKGTPMSDQKQPEVEGSQDPMGKDAEKNAEVEITGVVQGEAEVQDGEPETIADLTQADLNRLAAEAAKLPDDPQLQKARVSEVNEAEEAERVAERMFRQYVKRDGGFRKGINDNQKKRCRELQKRLGKTQLTWDQSILPL